MELMFNQAEEEGENLINQDRII